VKKRILRVLLLAIAGPALVISFAGLFSSVEYRGSRQQTFDAPLEKIWAVLNDVEGIPKRNASVVAIEILERQGSRPVKWRERMDLGEEALIAVSEWKPRERVQWTMLESGFGMTGTWTFEIKALGNKTQVTLHEASKSEKFMTRAALTLAGRDSNIKRMLKSFEEALK
jgi:uncharacterized membrane protein